MHFRTASRAALFAGLCLATVALVGCGGGGDDDGPTGRATSIAGVPDGSAFIDQDNLKFMPKELSVSSTEPVYFKNTETTLHTVTINGTNESGNMKKDEVFKWEPPAPGEYKITCDFHAQMKATITVAGPA